MATWQGTEVDHVEWNQARNTYMLFDHDGNLIAEISQSAFYQTPQLRMIPHGRHRRAPAPPQGGAYQTPGGAYARAFIPSPSAYITWAGLAIISNEPKRPVEDAGIRAGEITGLRAWRVRGDRLFSVYIDSFEWLPGEPARGMLNDEQGVHAFKDEVHLRMYLYLKRIEDLMSVAFVHPAYLPPPEHALPEPGPDLGFVTGTVDLWGNVIEHERGYRAEFGQVASLDHAIGKGIDLEALRSRYCGC